jgi:quercetin dioxygenase-like cupin family protein
MSVGTSAPARHSASRPSLERPLSGALLSLDLPFEVARLRAESPWEEHGQNARTLAKFPDLRVVLTVGKAKTRIPTHETSERITLQILHGRVRVWLPHGENEEVGEGCLVALDRGMAHEIEVLEECAFLMTITWPPTS